MNFENQSTLDNIICVLINHLQVKFLKRRNLFSECSIQLDR